MQIKKSNKTKFLTLVLSFIIILTSFPTTVSANTTPADVGDRVTVTATYNVRSAADSSKNNRLGSITSGDSFTVLEVVTGSRFGSGEYGNIWYRFNFNGRDGYVIYESYQRVTKPTPNPDPTPTPPPYEPTDPSEYENAPAYTDAEWQGVLNSFPSSYHYYLNELHDKYPAWKFIPEYHNYSLEHAIAIQKENPARNTVNQTGHGPAYRDMNYTRQMDAGGWYAASGNAIAFAMDPRNWLNERYIFMFEMLTNDPGVPAERTLERMFAGNQDLLNMIPGIMRAANEQDVSPVFIGARILMEVSITRNGVKTVTAPAKGTLRISQSTINALGDPNFNPDLSKNYYNVFNIGAYDGTNPQQNGVLYAMGYGVSSANRTRYNLPWDTLDKAISGGTVFIAEAYIRQNQNTNYYMKFNMRWPKNQVSGKIWHQYMTNVFAPVQEGYAQYSSYNAIGAMDDAFTFLIPVYENMTATPYANPGNKYRDNAVFFNPHVDYPDLAQYDITGPRTLANAGDTISFDYAYNYRTGTSTSHSVVGSVPIGAQVVVLERVDGQDVPGFTNQWYKINYNGGTYYIVANPSQQPVVRRAPGNTAPTPAPTPRPTPNPTPKPNPVVVGDANGDGSINIADLTTVEQHIRGKRIIPSSLTEAADANKDGNINIADLTTIEQHIRGKRLIQ